MNQDLVAKVVEVPVEVVDAGVGAETVEAGLEVRVATQQHQLKSKSVNCLLKMSFSHQCISLA